MKFRSAIVLQFRQNNGECTVSREKNRRNSADMHELLGKNAKKHCVYVKGLL